MVATRLSKERTTKIYNLFDEGKFKEAFRLIFDFGGNEENYYQCLENWYREKGEL